VRAKRVVAHLSREVGIQTADTRWALGLTQRGVEALRATPAAVQATRVRLSLEDRVARKTWNGSGEKMQGS